MSGKGSAPRPYSVSKETFDQSFERIFGKREPRVGTPEREAWQKWKNERARTMLDETETKGRK